MVEEKPSQHGLGHLLNPTGPGSDDRRWIRTLWECMERDALGLPVAWPASLNRPALSRETPSNPRLLETFDALNAGKPYAARIKPFNFVLSAHVRPFGHRDGVDPTTFRLIAPYTADPEEWIKLE